MYNRFNSRNRFSNNRNNRGRRNSNKFMDSAKINPSRYISQAAQINEQEKDLYEGVDFSSYGLDGRILSNLHAKKIIRTTKIQELTIPEVMAGNDVLGISATGSGKTGAFVIPLAHKLLENQNESVLIIAPTRELAQQIFFEALSIIKGTRIRLGLAIGGENIYRQIDSLRRNPQMVIGTPGRLMDIAKRGFINFSNFTSIVIDEVDRMMDMGFIADIKEMYSQMASDKQSLFFSATMDKKVEATIREFSNNYTTIRLTENKPANLVDQDVVYYEATEEKISILHGILVKEEVKKTVIFVDTKRYADKVGKELYEKGINSGVLHGDKSQFNRKKILDLYRNSRINVLVATNVAARGIDIDDISHVINLDEPRTYEEYIHRIGRTGRNGRSGSALTFVKKSFSHRQ
jgi:ATP-dependent RNA helicase RhlE